MTVVRADRVAELGFQHQWFVDGEWVEAVSGSTFNVDDPSTSQIVAQLPLAGAEDAVRAVEAAAKAFDGWSRLSVMERADCLQRAALGMSRRREALAQLTVIEEGMPLAAARSGVDYAASFFRWYAEEARRVNGYSPPHPDPRRRLQVDYYPRGVAGVITPWNAPLASPAKKIAAALAAGCTVVLKPSELTPLSALALAWILTEAGLPSGAFNVIGGDAPAIGRVLTKHPAVRTISFTGSLRTGRRLYAQSARHIKHVALELGGNAPFIIFADADLDQAVEDLVSLKQSNSGQICVTANRVYVERSVVEELQHRVASRYGTLKMGDGFAAEVQQGPLITTEAATRVDRLVQEAVAAGAQVICGGSRSSLGENFYPPTVISSLPRQATLVNEEIFGPVLPIIPFISDDEVIASANATDASLAAYAYTANFGRALKLSRELAFGVVGINDPRPVTCEAPFGGAGVSGIGREGGREGLMDFLDSRTVGFRS